MKRMVMTALLLMAGCATVEPMAEPTGPCAIDEAMRMRFVGTKFNMNMRDDIQRQANARTARILRPGDMTTKEFLQDRLNIMLDDGGQVEGLTCG